MMWVRPSYLFPNAYETLEPRGVDLVRGPLSANSIRHYRSPADAPYMCQTAWRGEMRSRLNENLQTCRGPMASVAEGVRSAPGDAGTGTWAAFG